MVRTKNGNFCPQDDKNAWITLDNLTMDFQEKNMFARHVVSKPKIKVIFLGIKRPKTCKKNASA